jgi:AraC family transcriptional regulator
MKEAPIQNLRGVAQLVDPRIGALVSAVDAERIAGFPSGRLFLDSVEQALAVALVDSYAVHPRSVRKHRGGLGPARLRTIKELVHAKMEDDPHRNGAISGVEPGSFFANVSKVDR